MEGVVRKTLFYVGLILLAGLWIYTYEAISGSQPLPARIPTHFDAAGNINGWGEPGMLWLLPALGTGLFVLMTLVAFFPQSFNFPVRPTPATRPQLEALALDMIAWLRAEIAGLFLWIQYMIIASVRAGASRFSPLFLPVVLLFVFGTIIAHIVAMIRVR